MPTVLRVDGFRFFFYSNEGQEPAHIHVVRQADEAKFWLLPDVRLGWTDGFDPAALNKLHTIVRANQNLFLEKWNEYFPAK